MSADTSRQLAFTAPRQAAFDAARALRGATVGNSPATDTRPVFCGVNSELAAVAMAGKAGAK